jgi:predicted Holliday junction resolvase-like endonuclease
MESLLVVALVLAVAAIFWLVLKHAAYRTRHKWTDGDLDAARHDSINRSRSVVSGRVQEHLAPLCPDFLNQFNPKDARFLGTPVDFIVFDGLDEGQVRNVCFVEVKTGRSALSSRERGVRRAIEDGHVSFQMMRLPGITFDIATTPAIERLPEAPPEAPPALQP